MSENLKFFKGLEKDLPTSGIQPGAIYHCTDSKNTYLGIDDTTMELFSSGKIFGKRASAGGFGAVANSNNTCRDRYATALGFQTTANHAEFAHGPLVWGRFNVGRDDAMAEVGIGSIQQRKNLYTLTDNGNGYYRGDLFVQGTSADATNGNKVATEKQILPMLREITYKELKTLRDNNNLVPGQQYRITDYHTTTIASNTRSADHQFDIIVTADSISTLNENARAIPHNNVQQLRFNLNDIDSKTFAIQYPSKVIWHNENQEQLMQRLFTTGGALLQTDVSFYESFFNAGTKLALNGCFSGLDQGGIQIVLYNKDTLQPVDFYQFYTEAADITVTFNIPSSGNYQFLLEGQDYSQSGLQTNNNLSFSIYKYNLAGDLVQFDINDNNGQHIFGTEDLSITDNTEDGFIPLNYKNGDTLCTLQPGTYCLINEYLIHADTDWPEGVWLEVQEETGYFYHSNLSAWELKYCLDSDKTHFTESGDPLIEFIWHTNDITQDTMVSFNIYSINNQQHLFSMEANTDDDDVDLVASDCFYDGQVFYSAPLSQLQSQAPIAFSYHIIDDAVWPDGSYVEVKCGTTTISTFALSDTQITSGQTIPLDANVSYGSTGTIYYMKDEFNNECGYDFKNIQFLRWPTAYAYADECHVLNYEDSHINFALTGISDDNSIYYYTFSFVDPLTENVLDFTTNIITNNRNEQYYCKNNVVRGRNNVLIHAPISGDDYYDCNNNILSYSSNDNTLGNTFNIIINNNSLRNKMYNCQKITLQSSYGDILIKTINASINNSAESNLIIDGADIILGAKARSNIIQHGRNIVFGTNCICNNLNTSSYYSDIMYGSNIWYTTLQQSDNSIDAIQNITVKNNIQGTYSNPKILPVQQNSSLQVFTAKESEIIYV